MVVTRLSCVWDRVCMHLICVCMRCIRFYAFLCVSMLLHAFYAFPCVLYDFFMRFCIRFVYNFYVVDIWLVCGYMQCMWLLYFSMRFHAFFMHLLCNFYMAMRSKYALKICACTFSDSGSHF